MTSVMSSGRRFATVGNRPLRGRFLRHYGAVTCVWAMLLASGHASGADIDLTEVPPFLLAGVAPNLVLTIDNSSSMGRAFMPDDIDQASSIEPFASPDVNRLYYDPWKTYVPGLAADGTSLGHAGFSAADQFPYLGLDCYALDPINLSDQYRVVKDDGAVSAECTDNIGYFDADLPPEPAFYFLWDPGNYYSTDTTQKTDAQCNDAPFPPPQTSAQWAVCRRCGDDFSSGPESESPSGCFTKIVVGSDSDVDVGHCEDLSPTSGAPNPSGLNFVNRIPGVNCTPRNNAAIGLDGVAAARRNFANWFVYYRSRLLMTKTVLSRVMHTLDPSARLTFQDMRPNDELWPGTDAFDWLDTDDDGPRFETFAENKSRFFGWMFALTSNGAADTNLQGSHIRAGEFVASELARADDIARHRDDPSGFLRNSCGVKCRNNIHLLLTDGVWEDVWGDSVGGAGGAERSPFWPCAGGGGDCWISVAPNQDGVAAELPENSYGVSAYTPNTDATQVYSDANAAMLSDVVFYYWRRDLDGDERNNQVPPMLESWDDTTDADSAANFWNPRNDPATWQHLGFFGVGLGVGGAVTPSDFSPFGTYPIATGGHRSIAVDGFPDAVAIEAYGAGGPFSGLGASGGSWRADQIPAAAKVDDLYHAALNGRGRFFSASAPDELIRSFADVLDAVSAVAGVEASNASVATNGAQLDSGSLLFQTIVDAAQWRGEVRAYQLSLGLGQAPCATRPVGALCQSGDATYWTAPRAMSANDREIITLADGSPLAFAAESFDELSRNQQLGLLGCGADTGDVWSGDLAFCNVGVDLASTYPEQVTLAKARIDYLRGDDSGETGDADGFRERDGHWLGDIIGSDPVVVGPPRGVFSHPDYLAFKNSASVKNRTEVVYVGANDGMLHAFKAADGVELFAYVPESVYARLSDLTDPGYGKLIPKRAFVDGPLASADAKFTDSQGHAGWKTVLVGSFGLGDQGIFALNITNPSTISQGNSADLPLWEFNDASGDDQDDRGLDGRDMGYSQSAPVLVRIDDDLADDVEPTWVTLVSNGYNNTNQVGEVAGHCTDDAALGTNCTVSQTGNAVLYVLNMGGANTQRIRAKLDTGRGFCQDPRVAGDAPPAGSDCAHAEQGRTNALGPITAVDADGDLIADLAYAGDLFGNLWRFDLVDTSSPPVLLFQAVDETGNPQPITSKVVAKRHASGLGTMVLFGTGQYLNSADKSDAQVQSFYGIWDDNGLVFAADVGGFDVPSRAGGDLLAQQFLAQVRINDPEGALASLGRTSTDHAIDWSENGDRGWVIDLVLADADPDGERVVVAPDVSGNRVVFVSMIPEDCCSSGGVSWINTLDANDGSRLSVTPFDYNLDGDFDANDLLQMAENSAAMPGSSIRVLADGGTGIYSAPMQLGLGNGAVQKIVSDSEGDLIRLRESTALGWRNWLQIR